MHYRRQKSVVLLAGVLLALAGAFAASHSTVRKLAGKVSERDSTAVTDDTKVPLSSAPAEITAPQVSGIAMERSVIAGGGGTSQSGNGLILDGTTGQSAAGVTSKGGPF